ncbi:hypothetical protein T12_12813 [Trichinella patagoniensis]|uniref:Uncharacterized protein n=1 Tax=Trichinella patagoniensis TaxID=990121 RepID=A0A0V1AAV2_9BILA|nr:hypothetical protein T12_12813 [Trichinella patagoniensis]
MDCSRTILAFILHQRLLIQHFRSDQELLIRSEMCGMNYVNIPHLNKIIRLCSRLFWKFPRGMPPAMPKATPRATSF